MVEFEGLYYFLFCGYAGVAHPVERHLAKVEVASSSLVARSKYARLAAAHLNNRSVVPFDGAT